jgi:3-oxoacyl-[acyl-carrier-protein] synthase-1
MSTRERVVITGMGIISCLGNDCDQVTKSLREGNCGIELLPERKQLGFNSGLSGVIKDFNPAQHLTRKQRKTLPEFGIWAWAAIEQALGQAGIEIESLHQDAQTGLIFGNDSSAATPVEQVDILRSKGDTRSIGSGHIFRSLTSTITLNISTLLGIQGMSWTVASACASGAMAIGQGAELIASGRQKRVICGGAQEITWESMCSFDTLDAFSRREDDPAKASRPFDTERDGLVPSGGAACLVGRGRGIRGVNRRISYR